MTGFPGPRVELHCHLDASVRPATIDDLAAGQGVELGGAARELAVAPPGCRDFGRYLRCIDPALAVLQTAAALTRAATELVEDWVRDDVLHGEVRFAPQLHTRGGLTVEQVVEAVGTGLRLGRRGRRITTGLLLCCLRTDPPDTSLRVAELAVDRMRRDTDPDPSEGVAGLDLAGDEHAVAGAPHAAAFRLAREAGLPITVHAGELRGGESIREAVDVLGARRIGHGTRLLTDRASTERVVAAGITVESCPWSNQQTGSGPPLARHPLPAMLDRGVAATVSTDCRTVSAITLRGQERLLVDAFGWRPWQHATAQLNAGRGAFLPDRARRELVAALTAAHGPALRAGRGRRAP